VIATGESAASVGRRPRTPAVPRGTKLITVSPLTSTVTDISAVVAGPDTENLGDALESLGVAVTRIDGAVTGGSLEDAGIADAALFVLTDLSEATGIAVAKEHNPDVRAVVYARETLPEFARGQTDLAVDPELLSARAVADELVDAA